MAGQSGCRYPSAKFVVLTDSESVASAKRKYFTWIISVTILFGITAGFLCHYMFVSHNYFSKTLSQTPNERTSSLVTRTPETSPPSLLHSHLWKGIRSEQSEFLCRQFEIKSEAVPSTLRKKLFQLRSENITDYINADLMEHYESVINEHKSKRLKLIFNKYQLDLSAVKGSVDFVDFLRVLTSNKFKFYVEYIRKHNFQLNLGDFDWVFRLTEELNQWYNYLDRLRSFMSDYEQQTRRKDFGNVTDFNFSSFTDETHRKLFHFVYPFTLTEKKLIEVNEIITEWTEAVQVLRSNCSVTVLGRALLLSEVKERLLSLNVSCLRSVYVYASRVIYLDAHLELSGTNLAIVSPNWEFLEQIKINLDGAVGEAHAADTAIAGQAGRPGNPGGNGGDFIGIGNFQEKFLLVSVDGGSGGNGQNGAKGRDGVNNTRPRPRSDKPSCIIQVKTFKNLFPLKVTQYEIYGEEGCGGPGTDGGVGGQGGQGGVISLIGKNSVKVAKGLMGGAGAGGKGGAGGAGGRNGCFYEAVDENDQFLHPVTTIKCPAGTTLPSGPFGKDNHNTEGQTFLPIKENLTVYQSVFNYIQLTRDHLIKYEDPQVILFLKEYNIYKDTALEDMIQVFNLIEGFGRIEYFQFFSEKLSERFLNLNDNRTRIIFNYLKSLVLGEITYFKQNINYFFIDMKNYLNVIKTNMKSTNDSTGGLQGVSYFSRKVEIKMDEIKRNLKLLKAKLKVSLGKEGSYSLGRKRVSCVLLITANLIIYLMHRADAPTRVKLDDSLNFCSLVVNSKSEPPMQDSVQNGLADTEKVFTRVLENIFFEEESEMTECLTQLRDALNFFEGSEVLPEEEELLRRSLLIELEHFIALYHFIEWKQSQDSFSTSLSNLTGNGSLNSNWSAEVEFLKARLANVMAAVQFKLAEDAFRHIFRPKTGSQLPWKTAVSDLLTQLNFLKDTRDQSPFCKNHMKAVFERNSTVGEFFSWPNTQIKRKLKWLFSGGEINLKSDLINRHVLDKSFLEFASLRLDFDCPGKEDACGKLRGILLNFKIDITHSGYSYYNWGDRTQVVVSEKVTLSYNFKTTDNQEPEVFNAFYKKSRDGEIKLSPYTTWTVRLSPLNENARFTELARFTDIVSLRLVGTGTYTL